MKKNLKILSIILFVFVVFALLIMLVNCSRGRRHEFLSNWYFVHNLKRLNIAIANYANNNSGKMPDASEWADLITTQNKLILREDFVSPVSHPSFGVCYNIALTGKLYSNLENNTVVLFMTKGDWNSSGNNDSFYKNSVNRKHSYLITLNGDIYRYNPDRNHFLRLRDDKMIHSDGLFWD